MNVPSGTTLLFVAPEPDTPLGRSLRASDEVRLRTATTRETVRSRDPASLDCVVVTDDVPDPFAVLEPVFEASTPVGTVLLGYDGDPRDAARCLEVGVDRYVVADESEDVAAAVRDAVAEATVATTRNHHERLVEYASDIIAVYDPRGRISYINDAVTDVLGYEPEAVTGTDPITRVHPDDRDAVRSFFAALRDDAEETRRLTYRLRAADGSYRVLESIGRNRIDDPELGGIVINSRDVTEREARKSELELRESIIEVAPIGLHVLDADDTFLWANDAFASVFGRTPEDIVGTAYLDLVEAGYIPADITDWYKTALRRLLSTDDDTQTFRREAVPVEPPDGNTRYFDVYLALLPLDDGEFAGSVIAFREVTERNRYERRLEEQNERLAEFASVVSHDLRNPLNVASGRLALARDDDSATDSNLEAAETALDRMERLVEDILSLARDGRVVGSLHPVELSGAARTAWSTSATGDATLSVRDELGAIRADETRLQQLLENLFRNSVEHGSTCNRPRADATVTVTVGPLADGFYVADDGPGIPVDERPGLFDMEDDGRFGLSIVETIATAHGWDVAVTESEDGGARFEFTGVDAV
ncbi:PAS domain-containing sensor histidine kinase [Haloarcula marina]|uniref:PAS domain-containing sensor histidine kinase n=1 Tax=Haloarcula marina TaxID=2961574 RepID=UPI0020B6A6AF|nr:PAS domain S-box protein [Halomicroarcula marina]